MKTLEMNRHNNRNESLILKAKEQIEHSRGKNQCT